MAAVGIELRPLRPTDRQRVEEMVADVWEGNDYLPLVFDEWISDPAAAFSGAELDGVLVGVQRLRPLGGGVLWYEGLRVASTHRRLGVAREMLRAAIDEARHNGASEIRLATANPHAIALFTSEGFQLRVRAVRWEAFRLEGDDPPRIPSPPEAEAMAEWVRQDPAFAAVGGVAADFDGAWTPTAATLAAHAEAGLLRVGPGGRALAAVRGGRFRWHHLPVTFLAGSGGSLDDLLLRLRFEADAEDLDGVIVWVPEDHPAAGQLAAGGYDFGREPGQISIYALDL
ncbi:MAG TPA: GNAT family N-acetyltransferase [Candidatus Dormibacteraeota bacterium]